jgi:hypothetical protein
LPNKILFPLMTLTFISVMSCSQSPLTRNVASESPKLGEEVIPPEEAQATKEILDLLKEGYSKYKKKDLTPAAHRIIHGKQHGCVRADFIVNKIIPKNLQHGIFSKTGTTFPAWVRLSNGSGAPQHDSMPDGRGLALKIMNVEGPKLSDELHTQDFLLQNSPRFFAKDVAAYVKFMKQAAHPGPKGVGELITSIKPNDPRDREAVKILIESGAIITNPFTSVYFSALPQNLGPHAMKLMAKPCSGQVEPTVNARERVKKNFLKDVMKEHLDKSSACIELAVQIQKDAVSMPIEDASVTWDPQLSPFVSVGKILIRNQPFLSEKRQEFCENVSFSPWHTLPEHRPLGGLNRVRKLVYEHSQTYRHKLNNQSITEPAAHETFE